MKRLIYLFTGLLLLAGVCGSAAIIEVPEASAWMMIAGGGVPEEEGGNLYDEATEVYLFENDATAEIDGDHDLTDATATYETVNPSPKQGTYSAYLNADTLSLADDNDFDFAGGDYSIAGWFNFVDTSNFAIMNKLDDNQDGWEWLVEYTTAQKLNIRHCNSTSCGDHYSTWGPTGEVWLHLIVAFDADAANELHIWVSSDGGTFGDVVDEAINCDVDPGSSTASLVIGDGVHNTNNYMGNIDEIVFFKGKALSAAEAETIWDGTWDD